jgi:hypothetical protein
VNQMVKAKVLVTGLWLSWGKGKGSPRGDGDLAAALAAAALLLFGRSDVVHQRAH